MMTSRSEYRLILRQDNADQRLTPIGFKLGLIAPDRYEKLLEKIRLTDEEIERVSKTNVSPSEKLNIFLEECGTSPLATGCKLSDLIRRPQINYNDLAPFDPERPELPWDVCEQVELQIKYEGYIQKQLVQIEQMRKMESKKLPKDQDYSLVYGLRLEAVEKLNKIKPLSIGQASRISGVSPADISMLAVWLMHEKGEQDAT
jgi:tRNA uridine 5-carboxymethylaminomethyl modification enzyme